MTFSISRICLLVFSRKAVIMNVFSVIGRELSYKSPKWLFGKGIFRFASSVKSELENKYFPVIYVSGIQPTGVPHLGNYFGFIQHWISLQNDGRSKQMYLSIADYHSISMGFTNPLEMRNNIFKMAASLLACGLDPEKTTLFQQSRVADHANLMYILGSLQTISRLTRMPQYKDKAAVFKHGNIPVNLQLYPILQAADVLLYKGTHVLVGDDQTQHLLLMRDLAFKCNAVLHCDFFPVPVQISARCARLKSLQNSTKKMSKSMGNDRSRILISDIKQIIVEKCAKALSDSQSNITYEPEKRPAVTLYALATGLSVENVIDECASLDTKGFKSRLAEKIDAHIAPFREKYERLLQEPQLIRDILTIGTQRAEKKAQETMAELRELLGFNLSHQAINK
uniref:tryptophan--tRNA ligase n=1 Tax=Wuchereria bancrofti TaxID=6293 RepID=A0A1I8EIE6_WUCBA